MRAVRRIVFVTGTTWAQEGQTEETMLRREDGGYDVFYEYTNRPGGRQLLLDSERAREFDTELERLDVFSWQSDIYKAPEPQGVRWSLLVEGDGFDDLALQGATHAFPPGFPDFVALMDRAFQAAVFQGVQGVCQTAQRGRKPTGLEDKPAYEWHNGAVQPDDFPFAHSK